MRYLMAILLPPLAVFLCGKPFQAIISISLAINESNAFIEQMRN